MKQKKQQKREKEREVKPVRKEIENRIFAEIARTLWGNDDYYNIRLNNDTQFQEAINNLGRAKAILD